MRTEVKAGLFVGLIIIVGVVFWTVNRTTTQVQHLPWPVTQESSGEKVAEDRPATPGAARPGGTQVVANPPAPRTTPFTTPQPATPPSPGSSGTAAAPPDNAVHDRISSLRPSLPPLAVSEPRPADDDSAAATGAGDTATPGGEEASEPPAGAPPTDAPLIRPTPTEVAVPIAPPAKRDEPTGGAVPPATVRSAEERAADPRRPTTAEDRSTMLRDAPRPEPAPTRYTVSEGDTLIRIVREHYGDEAALETVKAANRIVNENLIFAGQTLLLPARQAAARPAAAGTRAAATAPDRAAGGAPATAQPAGGAANGPAPYVVQSGDTLSLIARELLGDENRWPEIYELNKDRIKDPNILYEGLSLRLPAGVKPPPARSPAAPALKKVPDKKPSAQPRSNSAKQSGTRPARSRNP